LKPHLIFLKKRCAQLENSIQFYAQKLSFKNRYLLWVVYIRPYFVYCCSLLQTQTKSIRYQFKTLYQCSFKRFMNIPKTTPVDVLDLLLENFDNLCTRFKYQLLGKISMRYGTQTNRENIDTEPTASEDMQPLSVFDLSTILMIPENFPKLLHMQRYECNCHSHIMSINTLVRHMNQEQQDSFTSLFSLGDPIPVPSKG
jgi:hypothetical protein